MHHYLTQGQRSRKLPISDSDCRATSNDFKDLNMQLIVTCIVLFVTAVKARFSDFYFFIADPNTSVLTCHAVILELNDSCHRHNKIM